MAGFISGLGVTVADMIYDCIAGLDMMFIANFLASQQQWLRLIGGVFLLLGPQNFRGKHLVTIKYGARLKKDSSGMTFIFLRN